MKERVVQKTIIAQYEERLLERFACPWCTNLDNPPPVERKPIPLPEGRYDLLVRKRTFK